MLMLGIVFYRSFTAERTDTYTIWSLSSYWSDSSTTELPTLALPDSQEWMCRTPVPHHSFDNLTIE